MVRRWDGGRKNEWRVETRPPPRHIPCLMWQSGFTSSLGRIAMGVLGWGSTAPWLRRILGSYGRADLGSTTREAGRSRPKLPGNRVRLPAGATSTHDGEPPVHLDAAPSLRLTRP